MPKQRIHREWFRPVKAGGRKSCPNCKARLEEGESLWQWGEYHYTKWRNVLSVPFCKACYEETVAKNLISHKGDCGCDFELVGKGHRLPEWLTIPKGHVQLLNRLTESFREGMAFENKVDVGSLSESFRRGMEGGKADNVMHVENLEGLKTLAYDMGRDVQDWGDGQKMGQEMARWVKAFEISHSEWVKRYQTRKGLANHIANRRNNRARRLCTESGLDPNLLGIHPHNAMVAMEAGHPWEGVDYDLVKACQDELRNEFDPHKAVSEWDQSVRGV